MRALQLVVSRVGSVVRLGGRGRIAVVVLSALIAAATLAACGGSEDQRNGMDEIRSSGVLRVGTEGTYAPFSYRDPTTGELAGYDVDVANAVAKKMGVRAEFVTTPWDSIFAGLESRENGIPRGGDEFGSYAHLLGDRIRDVDIVARELTRRGIAVAERRVGALGADAQHAGRTDLVHAVALILGAAARGESCRGDQCGQHDDGDASPAAESDDGPDTGHDEL